MKKKIVIIFFVFIVLVLFFRSCGDDKEVIRNEVKRNQTSNNTTTVATAASKSDGLNVLFHDLESQKITEEEYLIYSVFSVFCDKRTPKKYRTYIINDYGTRLLNKVKDRWDSLSPEAKKQLKPYYVSPKDPECFINMERGYGDSSNFMLPKAQAAPSTSNRKSFVSQNGKVRIWYFPNEEVDAKVLLEAFDADRIYEKETGLIKVHPLPDTTQYIGDEKIHIFFDKYDSSSLAFCTRIGAVNPQRKYSSWIGVDRKLLKAAFPKKYHKAMKASLAHELCHSIQYAIDYGDKTWWWWQEATATWMENWIYPKLGLGHSERSYILFLPFWLAASLTTYDNPKYPTHSYGAYLFPHYLSQTQGDEIIGNLWRACEPTNKQILDVIEDQMLAPLDDVFMKFAVWMFNEKPEKNFLNGTKYITNDVPAKEGLIVTDGKNRPARHKIEPLGIVYQDYRFDDPTIESVDFDFQNLLEAYPDVRVWAMVKQKGQDMESQDWQDVRFKNFCFDIPEENLERVVLIYANCSTKKSVPKSQILADVTAYEKGCAAKVDLSISLGTDGNVDIAPTAEAANFFFNMDVRRKESGQAAVAFREVLRDKEAKNLGKKLIPFGYFTFTASEESGGMTGFGNLHQVSQTTNLNGSGTDSWNGKHGSKKGFGTISLRVYWPENDVDVDKEIQNVKKDMHELSTEEQIAQMLPPELSGLLGQVSGMQQQMGGVNMLTNEIKKTRPKPKKGQIAYLLEMNVGGVPAEEVKKGKTNKTRKSTIGMKTPVSIYRVVNAKDGIYSFQESGKYMKGTFNVAGNIRISKTLRERKSKDE